MGHINHEDLHDMVDIQMVTGIELNRHLKPEFAKPVSSQRGHEGLLNRKALRSTRLMVTKLSPTYGVQPKVISLGGNKYANTYIDVYSREECAYYLPLKSDTFAAYKKYEAWVKVQRNSPVKIFRSDRSGEFTSHEFTEHLENSGTVHHLMVHDSLASNGTAERANRTLIEGTRALLHASGLPQYLWAEVHHHFIWL